MSVAYVDTSALVAIAFGEDGADELARRLSSFSRLVSSNLLEAELCAACAREGRPVPREMLSRIAWILTDRPLSAEIRAILKAGYLRGSDLWHVATALYAAPTPGAIAFITLNEKQAEVAAALNFKS